MPLKDKNEPIQKSIFETLSDENLDIEQKIIDKDLNHKSKKMIQKFLTKTPLREKEIFTSLKLEESKNTKDLAKKYKISSERVRQIAEEKFKEIKKYLKNNLENQTSR